MNIETSQDKLFEERSFLVVDDFQGMRGMLRDMLRACGAQVKNISTASQGGEALSLLTKRRYDVVLCDYNLGPDAKNGHQLFEEAKFRGVVGPASSWVVISADKSTETVIGTAESEPDAYLIKPITQAMLRGRLGRLWRKKAAFAQIDQALSAGDTRRAIQLCDEMRGTHREHQMDLLRLQSRLLLNAGDTATARQLFNAVLAQRDVPWAQLGLARTYYIDGDLDTAHDMLASLVDQNRTYLDAYDWLARCLNTQGRANESEAVLERATTLSPNSLSRQHAYGELALSNQRLEVAERAFRASIALGEHSTLKTLGAYLGLARTLCARGKAAEALKIVEEARKAFDSDESRIHTTAAEARAHHVGGDLPKATDCGQQLASMLANRRVHIDNGEAMEMADLLLTLGLKDEAMGIVEFQVRNHPNDPSVLDRARMLFDRVGGNNDGKARIDSLVRSSVELMNKGALLAREGKLDEAINWMRDARVKMPSNARAILNLAHVLIMQMQKNGPNATLAREVRKCLADARNIAPQEKRTSELQNLLDALPKLAA